MPQAKRRSPGRGSGRADSSKGPSSKRSRRLDSMGIWREIKGATHQPLNDGTKSELLALSPEMFQTLCLNSAAKVSTSYLRIC